MSVFHVWVDNISRNFMKKVVSEKLVNILKMMFVFGKFSIYRSSHQRCSIEICVLKNFAKFTGKHLRQSLFFNKVAGLRNF